MKRFFKLIVILLIIFGIFYGLHYINNKFYVSQKADINFDVNYDFKYELEDLEYENAEITKEHINNILHNILEENSNIMKNKIDAVIVNKITEEKQKKENELLEILSEILDLSEYIYPKISFIEERMFIDDLDANEAKNKTSNNNKLLSYDANSKIKIDNILHVQKLEKNLETIYILLNFNCKIGQQIFNAIQDIIIKENLQYKYSIVLIYNPTFKNTENIIKTNLYIYNNFYNKFIDYNNFVINSYPSMDEINVFLNKKQINIDIDAVNVSLSNGTHAQINKMKKIFEKMKFNSMPIAIINNKIYTDDLSYFDIKNILINDEQTKHDLQEQLDINFKMHNQESNDTKSQATYKNDHKNIININTENNIEDNINKINNELNKKNYNEYYQKYQNNINTKYNNNIWLCNKI